MTIDITTRNLLISLCSHINYMQGQLEALHQLDDPDNYYWFRESVALRQKVADHLAAMADGPAVPAPTVMEIIELSEEVEAAGLGQVDFARAVLARWGNPAPSPADGEVAESVEWLRVSAAGNDRIGATTAAAQLNRAADLLEQQATAYAICERERLHQSTRAADLEIERYPVPVPVSVSERLPEPSECAPWPKDSDASAWCWMGQKVDGGWEWEQRSAGYLVAFPGDFTHWLPAHALPLPEVGE